MHDKRYDAKSLCDELFTIIARTIKTKLTPAVMELFKAHSVDNFSAIDLNRLATNILPIGSRQPAKYVFHYEKSFVKKADRNLQKTSNLQHEVQLLTNRLNVYKRELECEKKSIALLKEKLATLSVDTDLRVKVLEQQIQSILDKRTALPSSPPAQFIPDAPRSELAKMKEDITHLSDVVRTNSQTCHDRHDGVEQYTRRNTLELHGVPMTRGERTNDIAIDIFRSMGISVSQKDIDRSHRNFTRRRKQRRDLPPIILVKLLSHDLKQVILDNRDVLRYLPGFRSVYINENLTKSRRKLFGRVRNSFPLLNCYTNDGTIYVSGRDFNNGKKLRIACAKDYHDALDSSTNTLSK